MLERLADRDSPINQVHKAEAISLVLWDPTESAIHTDWPRADSLLRIEKFSQQVGSQYHKRYDGLPPHDKLSQAQNEALKARDEKLGEEQGRRES